MTRSRRLPLLFTVASGTLLNPLNSTMIAVALPAIRDDFDLTFTSAAWIISAYYLASALAQPVMGRLSDLYGPRRVFVCGLLVVAVTSVLAPLAPTLGWLLAFRVALAVGTSTLFPSGMTVISRAVRTREAQALGVVAMVASLAAALGPTLGGGLVALAGWPGVFLVNVPFALVALVLARRVMPADPPRAAAGEGVLERLDVRGVAMFGVAVAMLIAFLVSLAGRPLWWALPVALVAGGGFARTELRAASPFIDLRVLRANAAMSTVYVHFVVVNIGFYAILFGIPVYLQETHGFTPAEAGLSLLPLEGLAVLTMPLAARMIDRLGPQVALLIGAACATGGAVLMLTIGAGSGIVVVALVMAVFGGGVGFNNLGLQAALHRATPPAMLGTASGLFMTSRYFGAVLAGTLLGLVFARGAGTEQLHVAALVIAALSLVTVALSLRTRNAAPAAA